MNKIAIEAKIIAFNVELEGSVTNRRRKVIADELHRLAALMNECDKTKEQQLKAKHTKELEEIKADYDEQIIKLIAQLQAKGKEAETLKEEKRLNKLKAQNIFKKLNGRLTPDEIKLFSDVLDFIRVFVR